VKKEAWRKILRWVREISGREEAECDVCLIGSHARGNASAISDVDLVIYCDGEPQLKGTETMHTDETSATIFPANVERLVGAEAVDFYSASNPFEARLVHGKGDVLERLRTEILGKTVNMDGTKRLIAQAVSFRLVSAFGDAILDYGEGVRDMRVCLSKAALYGKLFEEGVEPWSIVPYAYVPEDELGILLEELYRSDSYGELSDGIAKLDLRELLETTFGDNAATMERIAAKASASLRFGGKHVDNYVALYLLVEEGMRRSIWGSLPGRWVLEREFADVDHESSHIACDRERVEWMVFIERGKRGRLERYAATEY